MEQVTIKPNGPSNGHTPEDAADRLAPRLLRLGALLTEWQSDAEAAYAAKQTGQPRGAVTGIPNLDHAMGGFLASGIHVIHGNSGTGKTAFTLQAAVDCGTPALFLSCEMGLLELFRRIAARVTQTFLDRFRTGELTAAASVAFAKRAAEAAPNLLLADASGGDVASSGWILAELREMASWSGKPPLLVVDSLHSWVESIAPPGLPEYDALNAGITDLRTIARRLDCPILVTAERNRASMKAGGINAGAGSRRIEYGAESVLDLHRKEDERPDANGEVSVKLTLSKNRNGAPGRPVELLFHGALQRFRQEVSGGYG